MGDWLQSAADLLGITVRDLLSLAGVVVALLLGVYGIFRDTRDRRDAKKWRKTRLVRDVSFWAQDRGAGYIDFGLSNGSKLSIWEIDCPAYYQDPENGELIESSAGPSMLAAGETKKWRLDYTAAELQGDRLHISFTDGDGTRWKMFADGKFDRVQGPSFVARVWRKLKRRSSRP